MSDGILGQSELTPEVIQRITTSLVGSYPRVLEEHPEETVNKGLALKNAIANNGDVETALKNFLAIDQEWKKLGAEFGIMPPDDGGPEVACGGLCLFMAGMAAGMIIEKLT